MAWHMGWTYRHIYFILLAVLLNRHCVLPEESCQVLEDIEIETVDDDGEITSLGQENTFEPTHEWKVIKEHQSIPAGLHIRVNLETGVKEAKLLDDELEEGGGERQKADSLELPTDQDDVNLPSSAVPTSRTDTPLKSTNELSDKSTVEGFQFTRDKRREHYYGESDRRGIINKKTKAFTKEQVFEMMKDVNDVTTDFSKLPALTSSESSQGEDRTKYRHSDPTLSMPPMVSTLEENLSSLSLNHDTKSMLNHAQVLSNPDSTIPELVHALEELEFHVHQFDNAKGLNEIGGLVLLIRFLNHSHPDVRSHAAHVIGSATQSNPQVQGETMLYGGLELLCKLIKITEPEIVQRRALFAISALLRGSPGFQYVFMESSECQGFRELGDSFAGRSPQMQLKAVTLLTDIINEQENAIDFNQTFAAALLHNIERHGWCYHAATPLYDSSLPTVEKALLAMEALRVSCDFTPNAARLQELTGQFQEVLKAEGEDEFIQILLQLCSKQLHWIRQSNKEL